MWYLHFFFLSHVQIGDEFLHGLDVLVHTFFKDRYGSRICKLYRVQLEMEQSQFNYIVYAGFSFGERKFG